jgi:hypothetical protein
MNEIRIFDNVFPQPESYRAAALRAEYRSYDFGHCVFHGIATGGPTVELLAFIRGIQPNLEPTLTFFRQSPLDQAEPNDIHTDVDMGSWTALLYLNPAPPKEDGTNFWTHKATGAISSAIAHERSIEGRDRDAWVLREHVAGKFNRVLMFPGALFHSRAIHANYGAGESARLVQVVFGKGELL